MMGMLDSPSMGWAILFYALKDLAKGSWKAIWPENFSRKRAAGYTLTFAIAASAVTYKVNTNLQIKKMNKGVANIILQQYPEAENYQVKAEFLGSSAGNTDQAFRIQNGKIFRFENGQDKSAQVGDVIILPVTRSAAVSAKGTYDLQLTTTISCPGTDLTKCSARPMIKAISVGR